MFPSLQRNWLADGENQIPVQVFFNAEDWTYSTQVQGRRESFSGIDELYQGILEQFAPATTLRTSAPASVLVNRATRHGEIEISVSICRPASPETVALFQIEGFVKHGRQLLHHATINQAETVEWPIEALFCDAACRAVPANCIACEFHNFPFHAKGNFPDLRCYYGMREYLENLHSCNQDAFYSSGIAHPQITTLGTCAHFKPVSDAWRKMRYGNKSGSSRFVMQPSINARS
jgi:hypothetical protein